MAAPSRPPLGWIVELHDEFEAEFEAFDHDVQDNLLAAANIHRGCAFRLTLEDGGSRRETQGVSHGAQDRRCHRGPSEVTPGSHRDEGGRDGAGNDRVRHSLGVVRRALSKTQSRIGKISGLRKTPSRSSSGAPTCSCRRCAGTFAPWARTWTWWSASRTGRASYLGAWAKRHNPPGGSLPQAQRPGPRRGTRRLVKNVLEDYH